MIRLESESMKKYQFTKRLDRISLEIRQIMIMINKRQIIILNIAKSSKQALKAIKQVGSNISKD